MSVEFEVRIPRKTGDVSKLLAGWIEAETFEEAPWVELGEDGVGAFVFQLGESLRGVTLRRLSGGLKVRWELRLNVCASVGDWRLAFSFLRYALGLKASVLTEDRDKVTPDQVTDAEAENRGAEEFCSGVAILRTLLYQQGEEDVALPNWLFTVSVGRREIPDRQLSAAEHRQLHDDLVARADRYMIAHKASTIDLADGTSVFAWAGIATISTQTDMVIFPTHPQQTSDVEYRFLPWAEVLEVLADQVEVISGQPATFYFPPFDQGQASDRETWSKLVSRGRPAEELTA